MSQPQKAAIVGGGVIGGGWAARFLLNGWDVAVFDPDPEAERKIGEVLTNARRSLPALYDKPLPAEGKLTFHADLDEAVAGAVWIQESVPERLDLKLKIHGAITKASSADAVIASSTSGFMPSEMRAEGARVIVAHPFNPVYLLPLIELVGPEDETASAAEILETIGMYALTVKSEIPAHIADRFLEAVWWEALWLIKDGVATTAEVDEAIRMGFGLRWAQMGLFETYRIAGGEAGMKHFVAQFGPALQWPWTKLMDVPDLTPELIQMIADQSDAQSGHMSFRDLERLRDDNLIGIMRALKQSGSGAGGVIAAHEAALSVPQPADLPVTVSRQIPQSWTDYNGHMNETHYLEAASQATDAFMVLVGADADYIASGKSYFTAESHIRYLSELHAGDHLTITTHVLSGAGKKMHLFHSLNTPSGDCAATVETILLHVDLTTRRTCDPEEPVRSRLVEYAHKHSRMGQPDGVGRAVGQRP